MNRRIAVYYRLTEPEKAELIEQCRKKAEAEKVKDLETLRRMLDKLMDEKWEKKKITAQKGMQTMLEDMQRQLKEAQENASRNSMNTGDLRSKLTAAEKRIGELWEKLTASEKTVSDLRGMLTTSEKTVNELREKLTVSEKTAGNLRGMLATSEKTVNDLRGKLTASEGQANSLRGQQAADRENVESLRRKLSESARENESLREQLDSAQTSSVKNALEAQKARKEVQTLEKKMEQMKADHETEKSSSRWGGWLLGVLLTLGLCVLAFPTHYTVDSPLPPKEGRMDGIYSGGVNLLERYSGFGTTQFENSIESRDFWFCGFPVCSLEFRFPDGGIYCGTVSDDCLPWGAGTYTRLDGEEVFGIWSWAEQKEVKISGEDYIYTGPLRFGRPYGYGVFEHPSDGQRFVGEYYSSIFRNGTWIDPSGTVKTVRTQ